MNLLFYPWGMGWFIMIFFIISIILNCSESPCADYWRFAWIVRACKCKFLYIYIYRRIKPWNYSVDYKDSQLFFNKESESHIWKSLTKVFERNKVFVPNTLQFLENPRHAVYYILAKQFMLKIFQFVMQEGNLVRNIIGYYFIKKAR